MKNAHCSHCGVAFVVGAPWPRRCGGCGATSYINPIPVAVVLLPVDDGVLAIRRAAGPHNPGGGRLALPGGYVDFGERWQQAAVRELREETGIVVDVDGLRLLTVEKGGDGSLLIFGVAPRQRETELPAFVASAETSERVILTAPVELAFGTHTEVLARFFQRSG